MARAIMLRETVTCDEHEDAILIHRATVTCPMCTLEAQLEDARERVNDIKRHIDALSGIEERKDAAPHA